jgi:hypothetical protein
VDAHAGLAIVDLTVEFRHENHIGRAVDGISLRVRPNKTVGVVAESGCGTSVTAFPVLRLIPDPPGASPPVESWSMAKTFSLSRRSACATWGRPRLHDFPRADDEPQSGVHRRNAGRSRGFAARLSSRVLTPQPLGYGATSGGCL